jgi:NADPH:quinone reductase
MATMKEAHVHSDTSVTIHDALIPTVSHPSQILIKLIAASCNPKDWKIATDSLMTIRECPNSGDNIAGIIEAIEEGVYDFKVGDRIATLYELGTPFGAYAEYAIGYD